MANSLGLDKTIKATESITAKLVRIRAMFQLMDLWLEWKDVKDPARALELAKHLQLLVGLSSRKQALAELKEWLPERALAFVQHEIDSIVSILGKLDVDKHEAAQIRGHLKEVRWCCEIARLIHSLERHADPQTANLELHHDQIRQTVEITQTVPSAQGVYQGLFSKALRLVTRTSQLWRELQREAKSFLTGADPQQAS